MLLENEAWGLAGYHYLKFLPKPKNWVAWTVVIVCYT
jgi:hypothetical protein